MASNNDTLEQDVLFETRGRIAIITLNLPKKLNALTQDHYYRVATLMREIAERDDIFITVLTGKGRFFSAWVTPSQLPTCPIA